MKSKLTPANIQENCEIPVKVCSLLNSVFYFFNWVYIIEERDNFRLVVFHNNQTVFNETYRTLRGARIAFSKFFGNRVFNDNLKPEWSKFYEPEQKWMIQKTPGM